MSYFLFPKKVVEDSLCTHLDSKWHCSRYGGECSLTHFDGCRNAYLFKLAEGEKLVIGNGIIGKHELLVLTDLRLLFLRVQKGSLWVTDDVVLTDISEAYSITDAAGFAQLAIVSKDGRHGETMVQIDHSSDGKFMDSLNSLMALIDSSLIKHVSDYSKANSLTSVIRFVNAINRLI